MRNKTIKVLSLHWGFSIGGIGQYTSLIDRVIDFGSIEINNICIVSPSRHIDDITLSKLRNKEIIIRNAKYRFSWIREAAKCISAFQPDFIMTHGFNGHFIAMILCPNIPKIGSYHGQYHATTTMRNFVGFFYNKFTEFYIAHIAKSTVCVANYCKEYLRQKGISEKKLRVIHNGIPKSLRTPPEMNVPLRAEWGVADNEILLGVVSRLDPVKGLTYLVSAFTKLAKKNSNLKLVVIGTGTLDNSLKKQINDEGIADQVIFAGFRSDIDNCLQAIDIFILPSLAEYHSIGLLEAMRAKKAIVATDVGGNTESIRDGIEGLIIRPANTNDIIIAVEKLLESRALRDTLAKAARGRFEQFFTVEKTAEATAQWFLDCYESL